MQPLWYKAYPSSRYVPLVPDPNADNIKSQENTVIFQFTNFQYLGLSIALSTAAPFRRPLFTNCKPTSVYTVHVHTYIWHLVDFCNLGMTKLVDL